jgi:LmbE family N-acetylglucosaminyl deacetylase
LDLTSGEPTPNGSEEIRRAETLVATEKLNVTWRGNAGLINRELQHTLQARRHLASYFRMLRPRWVFAPYFHDAHPDHVVATEMFKYMDFPGLNTPAPIAQTPVRLSKTPGEIRHRAPTLGEHTREIIASLGYTDEEITRLQDQRVI